MNAMTPKKSLVAVALLRADEAVVFQHRDNNPGLSCAGEWVFPGGHCDEHETLGACAAREFEEETGYRCAGLYSLGEHNIHVKSEYFTVQIFWGFYDSLQTIECREGQAMEFIQRDKAKDFDIADSFLKLWDQVINSAKNISSAGVFQ